MNIAHDLAARLAFAAAFLLLGAGLPAALMAAGHLSWPWLVKGAIAWAAAVAIKGGGEFEMQLLLSRWKLPAWGLAAVSGLWSATCELGLVAAILLWSSPYPGLPQALGLGFGAGCVEILVLGAVGWWSWKATDASQPVWGPIGGSILERVLTLVGHVASRGLVWVGLMGGLHALWLVPAMLLFAAVDGVAAYGVGQGWNWQAPSMQRRFYLFIGAVGVLEAALFWWARP